MRLLVALAGLAGAGLQRAWGFRSCSKEEPLPQCNQCRPNTKSYPIPAEADWMRAAEEEGLNLSRISLFGTLAPKLPRSFIERMMAMDHTKVFRYSFMGSVFVSEGHAREAHPTGDIYRGRRRWMFDFVRQNFTSQDFLSIVDAPRDWVPLGDFDHSNQQDDPVPGDLKSFLPLQSKAPASRAEAGTEWRDRDAYLKVMAKSQFTLCPGGDAPWSVRAFEAALLGSIPVIDKEEEDWRPSISLHLSKDVLQAIIDRFHYVKVSDLPHTVYNSTMAEENWRTFIKYMTFLDGDNEIPGMTRCECNGELALQ